MVFLSGQSFPGIIVIKILRKEYCKTADFPSLFMSFEPHAGSIGTHFMFGRYETPMLEIRKHRIQFP